MKDLYALLITTFTIIAGNAQVINIPDAAFKAKLLQADSSNHIAVNVNDSNIKIDTNNDGQIQVSEAAVVYKLFINDSSISDLTGIGSFANLWLLYAQNNLLTTLDLSSLSHLSITDVSNNQLSSLQLGTNSALSSLSCTQNQLAALNVSGLTHLEYLYCGANQITSLNVTSLGFLKSLICGENPLSSLTVPSMPYLTYLSCGETSLSALDLSGFPILRTLYCYSTDVQSLDFSHNLALQDIYCMDNQLTVLNISNLAHLHTLNCSQNPITTLNLNNLQELEALTFNDCQLTSAFIKTGMDPNNGYLSTEFFGNPNLQYICTDAYLIQDTQAKITDYGYTNCHANTYCSFTPNGTYFTIAGTAKYDSNSNGCDASDLNYPNLKLAFSDGTNSGNLIPDNSGAYHYDVQAATHTISPILENPSYFSIDPATATVTFPDDASPFAQNFCITPNGAHNDLEITLLPITEARPGFDATYEIVYKNKGTTTQSGSVSLSFEDDVLDPVLSDPTASSQSANSLSWDFTNLQPFESREIKVVLNVNSPTETPAVADGDVLDFTATIIGATDETPDNDTSVLHQAAINSHDPNDKTCLEGSRVSSVMIGEYVHYIIRFENTGSANAQNVVVKDIIDTDKFDVATLIPLSGSHAFETKISEENNVEFIFENISLPFDDAHNDSYVAFKIKTKPTLAIGDTFSNDANIYFDYNAPILTNTATTLIQNLGISGNDFKNYFTLSPVPAKNNLIISARQSMGIKSVNIYNNLGQLVHVVIDPSDTVDVSGLKTGSYFIRFVTDKITATGKFIKE